MERIYLTNSNPTPVTTGWNISLPANLFENTLEEVVESIRTGIILSRNIVPQILAIRDPNLAHDYRRNLKTGLPYFVGTIFSGRRDSASVDYATCLIVDIDHVGDGKIEELKHRLITDIPFIRHVFRSPSDGVKAIIRFDTPIADSLTFGLVFQYVSGFLKARGIQIDQ
ncbi:MAG: BT4734/BF3469 family protein, partial [Candidatus Cloacimonadaceae bacterium]|nr:BT4734/BF3469 family protein [Candidatus Cloacimonadaceae bacterium]